MIMTLMTMALTKMTIILIMIVRMTTMKMALVILTMMMPTHENNDMAMTTKPTATMTMMMMMIIVRISKGRRGLSLLTGTGPTWLVRWASTIDDKTPRHTNTANNSITKYAEKSKI